MPEKAAAEKKALITRITGQDGSLPADLLLAKGCTVYGTVRSLPFDGLSRISHLEGRMKLAGDPSTIRTALGWTPKPSFFELVQLMVQAALQSYGGNS